MATTTPAVKDRQLFNKNIDLLKGDNYMLTIVGQVLGYLKSHDIKGSSEQQDVGTKLSGDADEKMGGKVNYSLSFEALVSHNKRHLSYDALLTLMATGQSYPFEVRRVVVTETAGERSVTLGEIAFSGEMTISEVTEKSSHGEYESYSGTAQVSGPLYRGAKADGVIVGSKEDLKRLFGAGGIEGSSVTIPA